MADGEVSGLSSEVLEAIEAVLPEDAPAGHDAWNAVKWNGAHKWPLAEFRFGSGGERIRFQATLGSCQTEEYTQRVARACYMQFEGGSSQADVKAYRDGICKKIREVVTNSKLDPAKKAKLKRSVSSVDTKKPDDGDGSGGVAATGEAKPSGSPPAASSEEPKDSTASSNGVANGDLQATIEDAPEGHQAHDVELRWEESAASYILKFPYGDNKNTKIQCAPGKTRGCHEDARRVLRLCYMKILDGGTIEDAKLLRQSLLETHFGKEKKEKRPSAVNSDAPAKASASPDPNAGGAVSSRNVPSAEGDSVVIAAAVKAEPLKEDVDPGHISHQKVKLNKGKGCCGFMFEPDGGEPVRFQTTVKAANGSVEDAMKIARLCYQKFESGSSKAEVQEYRDSLYLRIGGPAAKVSSKVAGEPGKKTKKRCR
eukprot:TRINITY_DN24191_c0_g1_i1.p1 TRINITY_DN24191_c0_g1~~TRINITY_DN24191_c0_g1_i1.p1  ORF type:complete len:426 (-),score=98.92 TRINITY_DN24191_c0_g1_i1:930-2207(-)